MVISGRLYPHAPVGRGPWCVAGAIISQVIKGMPPAACRHLLLPLLPLLLPPPKCLIAITITILLFLLLWCARFGEGGVGG